MPLNNLGIVIPVFNEENNIEGVLRSWSDKIIKQGLKNYKFIVINDGSTDNTLKKLNNLKINNIRIITINNSGHGSACVYGYNYAIKNKFDWVLQIDGDGQCNPFFFDDFVNLSEKNKIIFGYRFKRKDGYLRIIFSRILSFLIFFKSFIYIKDPNVPYRLMNANELSQVIDKIPNNIVLKNVFLTIVLKKKFKNISYTPIIFDQRSSGYSKYNYFSLIKQLLNLIIKL
jgi:glycosyltransferase involved in cell wall biosynthesis